MDEVKKEKKGLNPLIVLAIIFVLLLMAFIASFVAVRYLMPKYVVNSLFSEKKGIIPESVKLYLRDKIDHIPAILATMDMTNEQAIKVLSDIKTSDILMITDKISKSGGVTNTDQLIEIITNDLKLNDIDRDKLEIFIVNNIKIKDVNDIVSTFEKNRFTMQMSIPIIKETMIQILKH
jgi:hypothetical protein